MKFKLDENLSKEALQVVLSYGHHAHTVADEGLLGNSDKIIFTKCAEEERCLITLDLDFTDVTRFNPKNISGIIVIRLPKNSSHSYLISLIKQAMDSLKSMDVTQQLWIVEPGRIRIHQVEQDE